MKLSSRIDASRRPLLATWLALAAGVLVLVTVRAPAGAAAQPEPTVVNLKPGFVAGRSARYDLWSSRKQVVAMSFMGENQEMESVLETHGEVTWRVDHVAPDGSATCTMTLDWLTATTRATDMPERHVDSRKASSDNPAIHTLIQAMTGVPITVEMAADGTVISVKGVEAIRSKVGEDGNAPDELDFMETAADLASITAAQDNLTLNRQWKTAADWNHELGKLHHDTTYTLSAVEEIAGIGVATVTGVSKLRLDVDKSKLPGANDGPQIDIKFKGGQTVSQVMFDLSRREAVGRNSVQTTTIEARITVNGQVLTRMMDETLQSQALRIEEK